MEFDDIARVVEQTSLCLRGGFYPEEADDVPALSGERPVGTVLLVGSVGPSMWRRFSIERLPGADPLDRWTRDVLTRISRQVGAEAVYPFQQPFIALPALADAGRTLSYVANLPVDSSKVWFEA